MVDVAGSAVLGGRGSLTANATVVNVHSSATGGYLRPTNTPLSDRQLENVLHDALSGMLGIPPDLVRPRWQPRPPSQPSTTLNWCAFGVTLRTPMDYPVVQHFNGGPSRLTRWSAVTVLVSLYGPDCEELALVLQDGLYIAQNREQLELVGIRLTDVGEATSVPDLVNVQWIGHVDVPIRLAQAIDRDYNILDLASSEGTITTDTEVVGAWVVNP